MVLPAGPATGPNPLEIACVNVDKIYNQKCMPVLLNGSTAAPVLCTNIVSAVCGTPQCVSVRSLNKTP